MVPHARLSESDSQAVARLAAQAHIQKLQLAVNKPRAARIAAVSEQAKTFADVRSSPSLAAKLDFVSETIPKYLASFGEAVPTPMVMDMLTMSSYLNLKGAAGFTCELGADPMHLFPGLALGTPVQFELKDSFRQELSMVELAKLPRDLLPAPGGQVWQVSTKGRDSRNLVFFTGTNSVGPNRDQTLTKCDATGALANASDLGIGSGALQYWLSQPEHALAKAWDAVDMVAGHSLGGAVAQEAMLAKLAMTDDPEARSRLSGWFASAPCLSKPCGPLWEDSAAQMLFTGSAQDPVRQSGVYKYPGLEVISRMLDLPISKGLGNSNTDGLLTQHGALTSTLLLARGDSIRFKDRAGTSLTESFDGGLPFDILISELGDKLRPAVAPKLFTPTSVEQVMLDFDRFGLAEDLYPASNPTERGSKYAYGVHLADTLLGSELVTAAYIANPEATLRAVLAAGPELFSDPKAGLSDLLERLPLRDVQITVANDTGKLLPALSKINETARQAFTKI